MFCRSSLILIAARSEAYGAYGEKKLYGKTHGRRDQVDVRDRCRRQRGKGPVRRQGHRPRRPAAGRPCCLSGTFTSDPVWTGGRGGMADAAGLGPVGGDTVGVQISPPAPAVSRAGGAWTCLPAQHHLAQGGPAVDGSQGAAGVRERVGLHRRVGQRPALPKFQQPGPQLGRDGACCCSKNSREATPSTPVLPSSSRLTLTTGISPAVKPSTRSSALRRQLRTSGCRLSGHRPPGPARYPPPARPPARAPRPASRRSARRVRPAAQHELPFGLVADHGVIVRSPSARPRPDRRRPHAARRPVHQQGLARAGLGPADQREQPGQVVQRSGRPGFEAHVRGQRQDPFGRDGDDLLPAAVGTAAPRPVAPRPGPARAGPGRAAQT